MGHIRSSLTKSCAILHSSLTEKNALDLERIKKAVIRLLLGKEYENYEDMLLRANVESLKEGRGKLCKTFPFKCNKS